MVINTFSKHVNGRLYAHYESRLITLRKCLKCLSVGHNLRRRMSCPFD